MSSQFKPAKAAGGGRTRPLVMIGAVSLCLAFTALPFYLSHRHRVRLRRGAAAARGATQLLMLRAPPQNLTTAPQPLSGSAVMRGNYTNYGA
jgi:hypothetical protein